MTREESDRHKFLQMAAGAGNITVVCRQKSIPLGKQWVTRSPGMTIGPCKLLPCSNLF
jgi:hypothetical protein